MIDHDPFVARIAGQFGRQLLAPVAPAEAPMPAATTAGVNG